MRGNSHFLPTSSLQSIKRFQSSKNQFLKICSIPSVKKSSPRGRIYQTFVANYRWIRAKDQTIYPQSSSAKSVTTSQHRFSRYSKSCSKPQPFFRFGKKPLWVQFTRKGVNWTPKTTDQFHYLAYHQKFLSEFCSSVCSFKLDPIYIKLNMILCPADPQYYNCWWCSRKFTAGWRIIWTNILCQLISAKPSTKLIMEFCFENFTSFMLREDFRDWSTATSPEGHKGSAWTKACPENESWKWCTTGIFSWSFIVLHIHEWFAIMLWKFYPSPTCWRY